MINLETVARLSGGGKGWIPKKAKNGNGFSIGRLKFYPFMVDFDWLVYRTEIGASPIEAKQSYQRRIAKIYWCTYRGKVIFEPWSNVKFTQKEIRVISAWMVALAEDHDSNCKRKGPQV